MQSTNQHTKVIEDTQLKSNSVLPKGVPYLDGIRGLAVLTIFIHHCWWLSGKPEINIGLSLTPILEHSYTAIDLFFVLSAFLLSQQWLKADYLNLPRPSTHRYLKQRFLRIAPAYYCCVLLMLLVFTPGYISPTIVYSLDGLGYLAAHLTFTHYLFPASASIYTINTTFWTLTHEVTFYLVLPWLVFLFLRNRWRKTLPILFVLSIVWLILTKFSFEPVVSFWQNITPTPFNDEVYIRYFLSNQFIAYLVDFGLGMVAANLYVQNSLKLPLSGVTKYLTRQHIANRYFLIGCVLVISSEYFSGDLIFHYFLLHISAAAGYTLMLMGLVFGGKRVKMVFSIPLLRNTGVVGYSIFLWHMPLINLIKSIQIIAGLEPGPRMLVIMLVTSVPVGVISTISYCFIEKPFMEFGRRGKVGSVANLKLVHQNLESETPN